MAIYRHKLMGSVVEDPINFKCVSERITDQDPKFHLSFRDNFGNEHSIIFTRTEIGVVLSGFEALIKSMEQYNSQGTYELFPENLLPFYEEKSPCPSLEWSLSPKRLDFELFDAHDFHIVDVRARDGRPVLGVWKYICSRCQFTIIRHKPHVKPNTDETTTT